MLFLFSLGIFSASIIFVKISSNISSPAQARTFKTSTVTLRYSLEVSYEVTCRYDWPQINGLTEQNNGVVVWAFA